MKTAAYIAIIMFCLGTHGRLFAQAQNAVPKKPGTGMQTDDGDPDAEGGEKAAIPTPDSGVTDGDAAEPDQPQTEPPTDPASSAGGAEALPDMGGSAVMGIPQVERDNLQGTGGGVEKPAGPLPDSSEAITTRSIIRDRRERERLQNINKRIFGSYRLHVAALKPFFEENDTYKQVYGTTSVMPSIAVDYFFFDWYATFGLTFRASYYSDKGRAVKASNGTIVKDPEGKVDLTLIPLQGGLALEMTPFGYKWLVASGWFGAEAAYFQEVRPRDNEDAASGDDKAKDNRKYTNSFWRYATAFGGSLDIRIDGMDEHSGNSLEVMGLRAIYLSPYVEIVQKTGNDKMHLSRRVIGLGFTFESIK